MIAKNYDFLQAESFELPELPPGIYFYHRNILVSSPRGCEKEDDSHVETSCHHNARITIRLVKHQFDVHVSRRKGTSNAFGLCKML
jgi:hypothetical protein